jgi:hypothetical protein
MESHVIANKELMRKRIQVFQNAEYPKQEQPLGRPKVENS